MSDDDLIRRGDALRALDTIPFARMAKPSEMVDENSEAVVATDADVALDRAEELIRALPAVSPSTTERLPTETPSALAVPASAPTAVGSAAERLARAVVAETNARVAVLRDRTPEAIDAANRAAMECIAAEAAFRAAPPAAEPAKPSPGVRDVEQVIGPACTCVGMTVPWHDATCPRAGIWTPGECAAAFAKSAEPAKEPAPCGTCGGSGQVVTPCPNRAYYFAHNLSCLVEHRTHCPSCRPGGAAPATCAEARCTEYVEAGSHLCRLHLIGNGGAA